MTATVNIDRPAGDPYRVAIFRKNEKGDEHFLFELTAGSRQEFVHLWKGSDIILREINDDE